jgi:hypothetical protein
LLWAISSKSFINAGSCSTSSFNALVENFKFPRLLKRKNNFLKHCYFKEQCAANFLSQFVVQNTIIPDSDYQLILLNIIGRVVL